jgi:hypothetical protein
LRFPPVAARKTAKPALCTWRLAGEEIMTAKLGLCRHCLLTSSALSVAVAIVVAVAVILAVRTDNFAAATPARSVPAFWVSIVLNLTGHAANT